MLLVYLCNLTTLLTNYYDFIDFYAYPVKKSLKTIFYIYSLN